MSLNVRVEYVDPAQTWSKVVLGTLSVNPSTGEVILQRAREGDAPLVTETSVRTDEEMIAAGAEPTEDPFILVLAAMQAALTAEHAAASS